MGKIKDKVFGLVVSKNVTDSLADSVKEGNQAKFYLAQENLANGKALDEVTIPDELTDRNVLIINGNKIQGINQRDLNKLDAITDVTKLFKYKGSVTTGAELLAKVPPEAEVGDVWNVKEKCEIDGVRYPAHTNFVCSSVVASVDGRPGSSTWDSLGGTMQIGTEAHSTVGGDYNDILYFTTPEYTPINNFSIGVDESTGLYFEISSNKLCLTLSTANQFELEPSSCDGCTDLIISTSLPIKAVNIPIGIGLNVSTKYGISVKLSPTNDHINSINPANRISGLDISSNGLFIAISSSGILDSQYIPEGLRCIAPNNTQKTTGGLILDGDNIAKWLKAHKKLDSYINSLIDAKLKAQ